MYLTCLPKIRWHFLLIITFWPINCEMHSKVKSPASAEMHISELLCFCYAYIRDTALNIKNISSPLIVYSALLTCNQTAFLLSRTADINHTFIKYVIRKQHKQLIHTLVRKHLSVSNTLLSVINVCFCRTAGGYCECNSGLYWRASSVQVYYGSVLCGA